MRLSGLGYYSPSSPPLRFDGKILIGFTFMALQTSCHHLSAWRSTSQKLFLEILRWESLKTRNQNFKCFVFEAHYQALVVGTYDIKSHVSSLGASYVSHSTSRRVLNAEWELQTRDLIKTSEQIRTARELQPLSSGYNWWIWCPVLLALLA